MSLPDVRRMFRLLVSRWSDPARGFGHGLKLVDVDGAIAFRTSAVEARYVRRLQEGRPQRLSRGALEALAVVAYRQPVTKAQVEDVRGVDSAGALKALLDRKLIRVLGKADEIGRPLLYGTTREFLDFFGLTSLTELPMLKPLEEIEGKLREEAATGGQPAIVMDLFQAESSRLVSDETEEESSEALDALEKALGEAKKVAKNASSLVFGDGPTAEEDESSRVQGGSSETE